MHSLSFLKPALRCAAALILAGAGAGAFAQAPLVPLNPTLNPAQIHRHFPVAPPRPETARPAVISGRSDVSSPRAGGQGTRDPFAAVFGPNSAVAAPPWSFTGPAGVLNAQGTFGGGLDTISGRVAAIAVDPTDNSIIYVASAGGGVWKTTDGGQSYAATTDFLGDTAMGSIAVAPSSPEIVYAGTGEANNSGDSRYGIGLLKSTDGASTWSLIPGPGGAFVRLTISKIVVSPTDPNTVYLTTANGANGVYGNKGVWKSTDGGTNWTNVTAAAGLDSFDPYSDLVLDPTHPTTLYTAIGDIFGSGSNGVYKTTDGGTTWTKLAGGLPTANVGRISLTLAASAPGTLYASIQDSLSDSNTSVRGALLGLYKTTDGGATWTQLTAAPNYLGNQGWYDDAVVVSPTDPNQIFAGGQVNYGGSPGNLYALAGSQDGGATFQDYSVGINGMGPHTDLHALTFTADGSALLDGNDGGIWRLENPSVAAGTTTTQWTDINANLGTIQFTGIALHPTDPTIAYGGSQDNGTEKYTGSLAWSQVRGGDGGFVRVDQTNPQTVYHEYYGISLERSDDGGATWNGATNGINPNDAQPPDGSDPAAFYVPYKLDPLNQSRVIYATNHVYESTDKGDTFTAIGTPGTAGFNPNGYVLRTLGVAGSTIYAAGTDPNGNGSIFVSSNDGTSWAAISLPGGLGSLSDIYVNPSNPSEAYASRGVFGGGKIFHTTNGGTSWTDVTGNLPDEPFNAVVRDPAAGNLYAGGDDGVYLSGNGGTSWSRFDPTGDFPDVQVVDLALSPGANLIGAGTHGRGLYEMVLSNTVSAPYNLTAVASYSKIALAWQTRATYGATYNVYRGTTPGGESATALATGITGKTYTDSSVVLGTTYYYTVKMVLGANVSAASNEASATATAGPPILYVPSAAYPTIQSAINAAPTGAVVQVADGTYTGPGNVDLSFGGKSITVQSQHGAGSTTIDCGGTSSVAHRAFLFNSGETAGAVVSGFTLEHADGTDEGAVRVESGSAPTIQNCVFQANTSNGSGAGLYNNGSATVTHCTFTGNVASGGYQSGAGIFSNGGSLTLLDCLFTGNNAASYGGGLGVGSGTANVTNCVFVGNTANQCGAILNFGTLTLTNCTSTRNTANYRALYNGGTATLVNDVFYGDLSPEIDGNSATVSYSDVQGGYAGTGNINADPLFVSPPTDLHLGAGSPCLGAGTHSGAPTTTIDGQTRPNPPSMGAYEAAAGGAAPTAVTVPNVSGAAGQTVTLSATLKTTGGTALSGKTITFSVDGTAVGTGVTNSSGAATKTYVIPTTLSVGSHTLAAAFSGDAGDAASSGTGTLTVTAAKLNTVVTVGARSGKAGTTVVLKSYLKTSGGAVLAGKTLTYVVNGAAAGSAVTDSTGLASLSYAIPASAPSGGEPIAVSFAGDSGDNPSSGTGTLTVTGSAPATSVTVAAVSGAPGQTVSLSATLKAGTALLSGKTLSFQVDGAAVGTAVTSGSGVATLPYAIPAGAAPGSHPITASFAGDGGDAASSGSGTLTVTGASKLATVVTVGARSGKAGTTVVLKSILKTSGGAVLAGKPLSYVVNGVSAGSAVTDSTGLASLTYTIPASAPAGSEPIAVSFGGDGGDNPSSGKGTLTVS